MHLRLINEHTAGTVHGLNRKIIIIYDGGVHIVLIVIPVTRTLPESPIEHDGSGNLNIAVTLMHFAPIVDKVIL